MSFVILNRFDLEQFLLSKGFLPMQISKELSFYRNHDKDPSYRVIVYTSIPFGQNTTRGKGKDAIRVVAVRTKVENGKVLTKGIAKTTRVHRTGTKEKIFERLLERMRIAYAECNNNIKKEKKCLQGPSPRYQ